MSTVSVAGISLSGLLRLSASQTPSNTANSSHRRPSQEFMQDLNAADSCLRPAEHHQPYSPFGVCRFWDGTWYFDDGVSHRVPGKRIFFNEL